MKAHVSLAFAKLPSHELPDFTVGVFNGFTQNAAIFDDPPVPLTDLTTANQTLITANANTSSGGTDRTDVRNAAYDAVVIILRRLAAYVEDVANGDPIIIEKSGFKVAQRGPAPQQPLIKTTIQAILNEVSTQLLVRLNPQSNAFGYEGMMSSDGGKTYQSIGYFQQARRVVVKNLTPGVTYTFKFRALGGSTGAGDWSDPVSHMAT